MILKHLLYSIIIVTLGVFVFEHVQRNGSFMPIIEGARTYPMPRRHPLTFTYGTFNNQSTSSIISMNTIIDQIIDTYFDGKGIPYLNTIDAAINYIVGPSPYQYGAVSDDIKSKLTDIGYYFLEVVIPMLPTQDNPTPTIVWPPLKWSGLPGFNVEIAPIPTYLLYRGAPENNFRSIFNSSNMGGSTNNQSSFSAQSDTNDIDTSSTTSSICGSSAVNNTCGIQCPLTCLEVALGSSITTPAPAAPIAQPAQVSTANNHSSYLYGQNNMTSFSANALSNYKNITTVGASTYLGNDITQIQLDPASVNNKTLTDKITAGIYEFFTQTGAKAGTPTPLFLEYFEYYSQQFSPMDAYHMEKLRDLVFYVLQTIVPGIPTPSVPHFYVQWRSFGKYASNP
jgi:hypothetical protein